MFIGCASCGLSRVDGSGPMGRLVCLHSGRSKHGMTVCIMHYCISCTQVQDGHPGILDKFRIATQGPTQGPVGIYRE